MANEKITPEHEAAIKRLKGKGQTTRQIAEAMKASGLKISHAAIARFLERTRESRAEVTKAKVRDALGDAVLSDLDELEVERKRLVRLAEKFGTSLEKTPTTNLEAIGSKSRNYSRVLGDLAKITDLRLHYAGADTPDEPVDNGAADRVLAKLQGILPPNEVKPE